MTQFEPAYEIADQPQTNGTQPIIDNRLKIVVDGRQVDAWEFEVLEAANVTNWMVLFSFYVENASGKLSPALEKKPIDEMTADEIKAIKESAAYKAIKRFKIPQLKAAVESFSNQAVAGF